MPLRTILLLVPEATGYFPVQPRAVVILTASALPHATGGPSLSLGTSKGGMAFYDSTSKTSRWAHSRRSGRNMIPPDDRAVASKCDADPHCAHAPCFQVQLEASRPRQAHRQSNACAYHVADVIQAQRAWAAQCGLADGQLTILAIEPADGGRQPGGPTDPDGAAAPDRPDRSDLRGFAFSTLPLTSAHRRDT